MKKTTRILTLLLATLMIAFALASCGEDNGGKTNAESGSTANSGDTESKTPAESGTPADDAETCKVTFANTSMNNRTVEKGKTLAKPTDPTKSGCIFGGWYVDANCTVAAQFPITVNADMTIYAKFFNYQEAFAQARNNTIGNDVAGFEYNYTLDVEATYSLLKLTGKTVGSAKYSTAGEVGYYDEHVNSGALFYDGSKYEIRRGTTLQKISLDKNDTLKSYSVEEVDASYRYDSSSFAKAVFTYSDEQLRSIEPVSGKTNVYKLKTAINASAAIALVGNYVNHPAVEKILGELPATAVDTAMFVTFANGKISSYEYQMAIDVEGLKMDLTYRLTFTGDGTAKTIVPREFSGVALSPSDVSALTTEAMRFVDAFRNKTQSGYDFVVKTGVDYGATTGEINATFQGSAARKNDSGSIYFHNDIEIDSDYKNKDLYKSAGIADIHIKETRLSNGDVYLIEKKTLTDGQQQVTNFTASDNTSYYLYDALKNAGEYTFGEKTTKDGVTSYTFGLSNAGVASLLNWLNASLNLDPFDRASANVAIYGQFNASSVKVNTGKVTISVKDGVLTGIEIKVEGDANTAFAGSADFTASRKAQIKLDYKITPNSKFDTFEPYATVKAAK